MISNENIKEIDKLTSQKNKGILIQLFVFVFSFIISYYFDIKYDENTSLFNDKLIDVCSIFFGVFIGSIYLFKKLKDSYEDFIKFSKTLLIQNLVLIFLSFFIILYSDKFPDSISIYENHSLKPKVLLFSIYIGLFSLTLWNIKRFISMITKMLKDGKE